MWKFHDFSITHILCEINFGDSRSAKTAVFALLGSVNFCPFGKYQASKSARIHENQNSEHRKVLKWLILHFKNPQN